MISADYDDQIRTLHAQGLTDQSIGDRLSISRLSIGRRRRALGLPSNYNPSASGRRGAAASPHASPKKKRPPRRADVQPRMANVERTDVCEKCGMPFHLSAPSFVVDRLHRRWLQVHLCEPGRYDNLEI